MIVCLCKVVSHRKIEQSIDQGARTVQAVGRACGAGTGCGACRGHIQKMIDERAAGADDAPDCAAELSLAS